MLVQWFHRTECRDFYKKRPAQVFEFQAAPGAHLDELLLAGYNLGFPSGSMRSGVFELQTDEGIWARPDGKKLTRTTRTGQKAVFKTWEELDHEETKVDAALPLADRAGAGI